jgi:hypothetical protein
VDIAAWLRGLGLERYEQLFRDNDIDGDILPELTDADLATLGVSLGHRRRLLKAIAARQPPSNAGAVELIRAGSSPGLPEAERLNRSGFVGGSTIWKDGAMGTKKPSKPYPAAWALRAVPKTRKPL